MAGMSIEHVLFRIGNKIKAYTDKYGYKKKKVQD